MIGVHAIINCTRFINRHLKCLQEERRKANK